jgi:hypothetical protein
MTRRPPVPEDFDDREEEPEEAAALRELLDRDEPEALRAPLAPLLPFDLLLELPDDLLEPPRPLLPLIPPLLRLGMLILG